MSHPRLSSAARRATLLAATLWLAGCAGLSPKTPEAVVTQRAEARWAYLIGGDFEKAWDLTQPGFRAVVKRDRYARRFGTGGAWTGAQVHEVKCEPERCTVRLRVEQLDAQRRRLGLHARFLDLLARSGERAHQQPGKDGDDQHRHGEFVETPQS